MDFIIIYSTTDGQKDNVPNSGHSSLMLIATGIENATSHYE